MIIDKFKKTDITKELEEFEERKQVRLPEQYRKFLLKYNGGKTENTSLAIKDDENVIEYFYGFLDESNIHSINHDSLESLLKRMEYNVGTEEIQDLGEIQTKIVFIAELGFGNMLAIGIGEDNYGQIFALDHEQLYCATKIADSFNEFVRQVESEPVDPIDKDNLRHPDDKKRWYEEKNNKPASQMLIDMWWEVYESMLNAEYEEVELED